MEPIPWKTIDPDNTACMLGTGKKVRILGKAETATSAKYKRFRIEFINSKYRMETEENSLVSASDPLCLLMEEGRQDGLKKGNDTIILLYKKSINKFATTTCTGYQRSIKISGHYYNDPDVSTIGIWTLKDWSDKMNQYINRNTK